MAQLSSQSWNPVKLKEYPTAIIPLPTQGRNPKTGQPLNIGAYTQPKFSADSKLKDACNGKKPTARKTAVKKKK